MKKSELENLALLECRNGRKLRFMKDCFITDDLKVLDQNAYDEDLIYEYNNKENDIVKVYDDISEENETSIVWERQEINWDKVPIGTKVLVRNSNNENWKARRFYKSHREDFYVIHEDVIHEGLFKIEKYKLCKLAEELVTIDELYNEFEEKCCEYSQGCGYCDYKEDLRYKNCKWAWLLDNYNVTRKEVK